MKEPILLTIYKNALSLTSYALPQLAGTISAKRFMTPTRHKRPYWEKNIISNGEERVLACQIKAWHWGEGPKILLMHGWDGRGSQLGHFVEPLVNAGFQVIAIDGPAHGDSPGRRTNLVDFSHKILASQDELGNFHAVIAHSFGGAATLLAANKGLQAEKLVLIASPYDLQAIFDRFTAFMRLSPQAKQHFQSYIETEAQLTVEEIQEIISHIRSPVLLIHDKKDLEIPYSDALKLKENLQDVDFLSTEDLGHRHILKSEQVINRVLDFLTATH